MAAHHVNGDDTDHRPENLVPLCQDCHGKLHNAAELDGVLSDLREKLPVETLGFDPDYEPGEGIKAMVQLDEDTRDELRKYKAEHGDTYDEAIRRLLDEAGWPRHE